MHIIFEGRFSSRLHSRYTWIYSTRILSILIQNIVEQMPPHQVGFEREANRNQLGVEFYFDGSDAA
jgi:hypothetical protein